MSDQAVSVIRTINGREYKVTVLPPDDVDTIRKEAGLREPVGIRPMVMFRSGMVADGPYAGRTAPKYHIVRRGEDSRF